MQVLAITVSLVATLVALALVTRTAPRGIDQRCEERHEGLVTAPDERAGRLVDPRDCDDDVLVEGEDPQSPRSFSASLSVATSSVGFLAPASSVSPWRLTQMTGTLSFVHGSTSW